MVGFQISSELGTELEDDLERRRRAWRRGETEVCGERRDGGNIGEWTEQSRVIVDDR